MPCFVSTSTDPYFHLAVEDWLLREYQGELPVWFVYRNRPCVVVGRFQNPWKECDLGWMHARGLELVRRPSGGGTVWHDLGNVNFCCVRPLAGFKKDQALEVLQEKLRGFGVSVEINARHDLVVRAPDQSTRKVSGSAYKQTKDRALHHGTLLLSANLDDLESSLNSPVRLTSTRSIASVRSQVQNLSDLSAGLTPEAWLRSWSGDAVVSDEDPRFRAVAWADWAWRFGETPAFEWEFTVGEHTIRLQSHKGLIREFHWDPLGISTPDLGQRLCVETFVALARARGVELELSRWRALIGA